MAKRLYDLLVLCKDEEEVKSEFAKFLRSSSLRINIRSISIQIIPSLSLNMTVTSKAEQKELRL